ncbi:PUA-like domain-containing protein [Cytidiella melzeri]|nr:PUA-like domain-containing protein [Cytidiella melzeri]
MVQHWLMKAEPDSRIVKGKDVKFSVDDFEAMKTTPWEGVRNAEARNLMKEMCVGDKVLFYHSNCKTPGIAAFAKVSKEAHPDCTAWDPEHPYYDAKTDKNNPKWYMVEVTFHSRAANFVPLSLLRRIAASPGPDAPSDVEYIGNDGLKAIKDMALVSRGRLSVQRVEGEAWVTIELLAEKGGWDEGAERKPKQRKTKVQFKDDSPMNGASSADSVAASKKSDLDKKGPTRRSSRNRGTRS